jgi:hypothetical protein
MLRSLEKNTTINTLVLLYDLDVILPMLQMTITLKSNQLLHGKGKVNNYSKIF